MKFSSLPVSIDHSRPASALLRYAGPLRGLSTVRLLFLFIVVIPSAISIIYYGLWASDRYVSESQFIVRSVKSPRIGGLDAIFRTFGMSASDDDASAVEGYLESRDAVRDLEARLPLRKMFSGEHADLLARFPRPIRGDTFEALYEYYLGRVTLIKSTRTGINVLRVVAFTPEDAQKIARTLVTLSEDLVNRMNQRAQNDAMNTAEQNVDRAQKNVIDRQARITAFRNRELMVDPSAESLKMVELIGTLNTDLVMTSAQLDQTKASTPSGPGIQSLRARANALQNQINAEQAKVAGNREAMASKISEYEELALARSFADSQLLSVSASLESAIQDARRQQIYLEQVVTPNLPDESVEPRRLRLIITTITFSFTLFAMAWILFVGAKEHAHG